MFSLYRRFVFAASVVFGLAFVQPATAASILVFGDGFGTSAASDLATTLTGLGHTVVNHGPATPLTDSDFIGIDTAWHVGSSAAYITNGTTPSAIQNFLFSGGGLHLTGENASFASVLNTALLDNLVNPFITDPTVLAGGNVTGTITIANTPLGDILTTPNNIVGSVIGVITAGELIGVDADSSFASSGSGQTVGAIYRGSEMIVPGARLSIITDVNWLLNTGDIDVVENLQTFLEGEPTVVAMPEPGTAALLAVAGLFVVANRRRKRV